MKICTKCKEIKPENDFHKYSRSKDGLQYYCKSCVRQRQQDNKEELSRYRKEWGRKNKNRTRDYALQNKFGISLIEYEQLSFNQNDVCAICKEECNRGNNLVVDHNHSTGEVRGLLCHRCNTAIGLMRDNIDFLKSAIEYLS